MEFQRKGNTKGEKRFSDSQPPYSAITALSPSEILGILQRFPQNQVMDLLLVAAVRHFDILMAIRTVADNDITLRKLFVRCLAEETTTGTLRRFFSPFGPIQDAVVIFDKKNFRSKGYGFVTFKHIESAVLAMKKPSKRIDGRMTVSQLASDGMSNRDDLVWKRKIFVGNVPFEISSNTLLNHFMRYGVVEEGPIAFYKGKDKSKGFAFFVYKTEEAAKASLREPMKIIDGYQVHCKLAVVEKEKTPPETESPSRVSGDDGTSDQKQKQQSTPDMMAPQYGGYGGDGFQGHPTLHDSPMMASHFGNSGGGGGIGGPFGDYGEKKGKTPPRATASRWRVSRDGMSDQKQKQQSTPDMMAPQYGGYGGDGFQGHPTLHDSPMMASHIGNSGGGGRIGGPFGDYGEKKGKTPPRATASPSRVSGDGMSGQKQKQQSTPDMMAPQCGGYGGGGFQGHPTLHDSPMMVSQFGNSGGGGGIGGSFGDYGEKKGKTPPQATVSRVSGDGMSGQKQKQQSTPDLMAPQYGGNGGGGFQGHPTLHDSPMIDKKGKTPPPATASWSLGSGDGMSGQKQKQQQQSTPDLMARQYGENDGGGFQGHPTLHASPVMASQFGNSGGGGGIGGSFGDYGGAGRFPPPKSAVGMASTSRGFKDDSAQQSMSIPKLLPRGMFRLPYL